ncbi:uncharacterized protein LOC130997031 [Salvia miltiorrhiza]|uniref:uncharacterized protein LOC130997031 n=1 Tax=Salvia miltiorrhiza TaxID=226208 RepID=UPI0025AB5E78|nr:uncharacterized protein LOC130997031 [Salvia miltiorrhiza]
MSTTSLATHFTASLLLCPLGLRRLLCSSSLYLTNPSLYRSRTWYFSQSNWKTLDIYSLLILLPIASLSHIVFFLAISESPIHKFSFLQQSFVISLFWVILILIVAKESFDLCSFLPDNLVFAFAAIAFLIEFYMAGRGLIGFGVWLYRILGYFTLLCAGCCLCLSVRPSAFFAEFLLSCGLVLKGSWVLQVGLSLYTDAFGLKGCGKIERGEADVKCELDDDVWRGVALVNLVFVGHVIVVIVIGFVSFGLLHNRKRGEGSGLGVGSESMLMHPLPEIEIE